MAVPATTGAVELKAVMLLNEVPVKVVPAKAPVNVPPAKASLSPAISVLTFANVFLRIHPSPLS